jgi:glycosyltransferase involved in cell wall biosynthesis
MSEIHLHIISFDIPYPPNYGGVIDVYYKLKALHAAGVKIHLHCFEYRRKPAPELNKYCYEAHYYPRKTSFLSALSWKPYIIYSRRSKELLQNLCRDNHPILFEGLHSCYYLSDKLLKDRLKIYRESNIEHQYYYHLFKAEKKLFNKIFFLFSGLKLRAFQGKLSNANLMLTVSKEDNAYLVSKFKQVRIEYLPSFHRDDEIHIIPGKGDYILYQGNLSVVENSKAAEFLITKVFAKSGLKLVIAGLNPPDSLIRIAKKHDNVTLIPNPSGDKMVRLIKAAHINVMVTFQPTGLKLKILNALFNGRFCLVNKEMVSGTELAGICEIANNPETIREKAEELMNLSFTSEMIFERKDLLMQWHSNKENCKTLMNLLSLLTST